MSTKNAPNPQWLVLYGGVNWGGAEEGVVLD